MVVGHCLHPRLKLFVVFLLSLILLLQLPPPHLHTSIPGSALSASVSSPQTSWIINSGASHHMTGMSTLFHTYQITFDSTYQITFDRDKMCIVDGSYSSVASHGDTHATSELSLSSVLHVPNFTLNLLSISYLTQHLHCFVTFFPSYGVFQDLEMKTIDLGREKDRLYIFDSSTPIASSVIKGNSLSSDELLWHRRLGHPSFSLLHQMFLQCSSSSFLIVNYVSCLNNVGLFTQ